MTLPNQQLLLPTWIATMQGTSSADSLLTGAALLLESDKIAAIGPSAALMDQYPQATRIDLSGHLLTPGFINMHTHAGMTLLRGSADDLPLKQWLEQRIWPMEARLLSAEFVYDGALLAAREMLLGGTTLFNDMYFYPDSTARAATAMGMRAVIGLPVLDFATPYASDAADYIRKGLDSRDRWRHQDGIEFSLAPHAPYTVSDAGFIEISQLASELNLRIQCHVHETVDEVAHSVQQFGLRPLARLANLGVLSPDFLAIHAVHLDPSDFALLLEHGVPIAHCPHSNLKLASGIAPVAALRRAGVKVGFGTDGSASNNRLDLLSEARTAALLAKCSSNDASEWSAHDVLRSLTIEAAQALGVDSTLGSISIGKQADLVAIDLADISMQPVYDPVSQLIHSAGREQVNFVWIAGRNVVWKRQVVSDSARRSIEEVTAGLALWHNSVGEIVKAGH